LTRGVAIDNKVFARIRRSKHWSGSQLVLEGLETLLTLVCPLKLNAFVKQISQRLSNLGKVLDESTAIACKDEKTSHLLNVLQRSPVKNSLNSFRVNSDTILGNHMTKVGYFQKPEFTFGELGIQLMLSKLLQNKTKMFSMLFLVLRKYQDIIQIYHDELVEVIHEDIIHQAGERSWSIRQAK
jgi:hypothetical protein